MDERKFCDQQKAELVKQTIFCGLPLNRDRIFLFAKIFPRELAECTCEDTHTSSVQEDGEGIAEIGPQEHCVHADRSATERQYNEHYLADIPEGLVVEHVVKA